MLQGFKVYIATQEAVCSIGNKKTPEVQASILTPALPDLVSQSLFSRGNPGLCRGKAPESRNLNLTQLSVCHRANDLTSLSFNFLTNGKNCDATLSQKIPVKIK